jgi:c(7)-type cytochrome triheme protein
MASIGMIAALLGGFALLAPVHAQTLPRLPGEFLFVAKEDNPGPVVFNHRTHVNPQHPNCLTCHPVLFSILNPGKPADGLAMSHKQMRRGKDCGVCHNGKVAFGTKGTKCVTCHEKSTS